MATLRLFCFVLIASVQGISIPDVGNSKAYEFPEDFMFGVATAAYQIEGGFNEDGRGPSIWDTLTHERNYLISDHSTGDVACDSYHKYKDDIQLMKDLGVQFYRFSFSWSRILPDGHANLINQAGIDYYNNVINELLSNNIQPMATIYHWDLPQVLQDLGGWPNPVIADYYLDYARILFENFGDRVKYWITFNEAKTFTEGYESDSGHAPALDAAGYGKYLSAHTVVRAHAKAYHLYDEEFRPTQQGKVGITLDSYWCEVYENSTAYIDACDRKLEFSLGIFANPIYSEGDFTAVVKDRVAAISASQGFSTSRLPALTQEDIEYIRGTHDFFGLNHYSTYYAMPSEDSSNPPAYYKDKGLYTEYDPSWPESASSWLRVVPWGLRKLLVYISNKYNTPPIIITENGYSDNGELNDTKRVDYYTSYLTEMLKAIHEDGVNVFGYTAWSIMDNFEWTGGYTQKFGLYQVDFNDPDRPRTMKESAKVYSEIIASRQIPQRLRK